jgi:ROK family
MRSFVPPGSIGTKCLASELVCPVPSTSVPGCCTPIDSRQLGGSRRRRRSKQAPRSASVPGQRRQSGRPCGDDAWTGGGAELYVLLSVGVGLGIGIDGQVFRGAGGIAGELGHVVIDDMGPLCRCGNRGCLESKVSVNTLRDAMRDGHGPVSVKDCLQMALDGNIGAQRIIGAAAGQVGRLVGDLCNYFNPDVVLVGGELSAAGDIVLNPLRDSLRRYAIARARENVRVQRGALGDLAELYGALIFAGEDRIASSGSAISGRVSCDSKGLRRHFLPPAATRLPGFERALRSPST